MEKMNVNIMIINIVLNKKRKKINYIIKLNVQ